MWDIAILLCQALITIMILVCVVKVVAPLSTFCKRCWCLHVVGVETIHISNMERAVEFAPTDVDSALEPKQFDSCSNDIDWCFPFSHMYLLIKMHCASLCKGRFNFTSVLLLISMKNQAREQYYVAIVVVVCVGWVKKIISMECIIAQIIYKASWKDGLVFQSLSRVFLLKH